MEYLSSISNDGTVKEAKILPFLQRGEDRKRLNTIKGGDSNQEKQRLLSEMDIAARQLEMAQKRYLLSKHKFPEKPSSDGYYHKNIRDETKKSKYRQIKKKH